MLSRLALARAPRLSSLPLTTVAALPTFARPNTLTLADQPTPSHTSKSNPRTFSRSSRASSSSSPRDTMSEADRRSWNYPFWLDVQTRWSDNDQYGHMNNSAYYYVSDSAINAYLVRHCGILPFVQDQEVKDIQAGSAASLIGLIISSSATYHAPASFPCKLRAGVRVLRLGNSSVLWEIGIYILPPEKTDLPADAKAIVLVRATHVFVDRSSRRPHKPLPQQLRQGLLKLTGSWTEQQDEKRARL